MWVWQDMRVYENTRECNKNDKLQEHKSVRGWQYIHHSLWASNCKKQLGMSSTFEQYKDRKVQEAMRLQESAIVQKGARFYGYKHISFMLT